jgi:hypothetical protein
MNTITIPISAEDRQRGFESAQAVADYFRQEYGEKMQDE